jgi:hypothetical protein
VLRCGASRTPSNEQDSQLRGICSWKHVWQILHEAIFSRAFAEFERMELPQVVHEALIAETQTDRLIGHCARLDGH